MIQKSDCLTLGYDWDKWYDFGVKEPISVDISSSANSHILICGMSGSGKSFCEQILFAKLALCHPEGHFYFADFKQDDQFSYLRGSKRYYPYKESLDALDLVYEKCTGDSLGRKKTVSLLPLSGMNTWQICWLCRVRTRKRQHRQ